MLPENRASIESRHAGQLDKNAGGEQPVRHFDNTPLEQAIDETFVDEQGVVSRFKDDDGNIIVPESPAPLLEEARITTAAESSIDTSPSRKVKIIAGISAALVALGVAGGISTVANKSNADAAPDTTSPEGTTEVQPGNTNEEAIEEGATGTTVEVPESTEIAPADESYVEGGVLTEDELHEIFVNVPSVFQDENAMETISSMPENWATAILETSRDTSPGKAELITEYIRTYRSETAE